MRFKWRFIVVSHIGETYSEDEHIQGRQGGYDPATYQWVGIAFYIYTYILDFPRNQLKWKVCWNEIWNIVWFAMHRISWILWIVVWCIYVKWCGERTGEYQVSIITVMMMLRYVELINCTLVLVLIIIHRIVCSPWIQVDASRTDHRGWFRHASRTDHYRGSDW